MLSYKGCYKLKHVCILCTLCTDPFSKVDHTSTRWLDENRAAEWRSLETKITEWYIKFHFLLRQLLHFLTETFKSRLQFVPQFTFCLEFHRHTINTAAVFVYTPCLRTNRIPQNSCCTELDQSIGSRTVGRSIR